MVVVVVWVTELKFMLRCCAHVVFNVACNLYNCFRLDGRVEPKRDAKPRLNEEGIKPRFSAVND